MSLALSAAQAAHVIALGGPQGTLTPDTVVADARATTSPLHPLFEWDQAKQAAAYLTDRARVIIRSVRYLPGPDRELVSTQVSYYVRDPNADAHEQGYVSIPVLLTDRDRALRALQGSLGQVVGQLERLREAASVLGLSPQVEPIIDSLVRLRAEVA